MELWAVPCAEPPVKPVPVGAVHVYLVPAGTPEGVTLNVPPLHIVAVLSVTVATGLIVTVAVKLLPVQDPDVGVTVYVAVAVLVVVFVSVWLIELWPVACAEPPVKPLPVGALHV